MLQKQSERRWRLFSRIFMVLCSSIIWKKEKPSTESIICSIIGSIKWFL